MIEERSTRLLEQLESRAAALLGVLRASRVQQDALHTRLAELERRRVELEASNAELAAEAREEQAGRQALAQHCSALEARLADLEATRLELAEENRELDEQNRELEAHNRRLLEQAPAEASAPLFHRQARRAQGLSALIGHRPRRQEADAPEAPAAASEAPEAPAAASEAPAAASEAFAAAPEAPAAASQASDAPAPEAHPAPKPGTSSETPSGETPANEAPSPQALLNQWYQRYSATFFKGHTRPLKVGIHEELTAREPWPEKLVRRALACYVNLPRYLKSVREGAERLDLAGEPAGRVDAAAAEHAHKKLERLQAERGKQGRPPRQRAARKGRGKGRDPGDAADRAQRRERPAAKPPASAPRPTEGDAPATLEEKLTALLAKHNQR